MEAFIFYGACLAGVAFFLFIVGTIVNAIDDNNAANAERAKLIERNSRRTFR